MLGLTQTQVLHTCFTKEYFLQPLVVTKVQQVQLDLKALLQYQLPGG
jgi:hypothetical protein